MVLFHRSDFYIFVYQLDRLEFNVLSIRFVIPRKGIALTWESPAVRFYFRKCRLTLSISRYTMSIGPVAIEIAVLEIPTSLRSSE